MDFSKPRAKKSKKIKIKPAKILIAYEGAVSEKEYFEELKSKIPRQFVNLIDFIPVGKTDYSRSSPSQVLQDLIRSEHYNQKAISKGIDYAFIVIDKDHHFDDTHARDSVQALQMCRQKNISVVCSTPSFDLWRLLHCSAVNTYSVEKKSKILSNNNRYVKTLCTQCGIGATFNYFELIPNGIFNAEQLNSSCQNSNIPNEELFTNMTSIFNVFNELNVNIFKYI
ncbi:RloB family protein [Alteromonas australica]|uniref:RloB family protein n=1 Tax=Alteromonas australica TaxID=589873 RepID=UPI003F66AAAE